jgi:hypothetical protein
MTSKTTVTTNAAGVPPAPPEAHQRAVLALDGWAGRRLIPVEVIGHTPKRVRVRILAEQGAMLPGRRWAAYGDVVLAPRHAVVVG